MSGFNVKYGFILFIYVIEKVWEIKCYEFILLLFNLFCFFLNFLEYNFYVMNLVFKFLQYIKQYFFEEFLGKKYLFMGMLILM